MNYALEFLRNRRPNKSKMNTIIEMLSCEKISILSSIDSFSVMLEFDSHPSGFLLKSSSVKGNSEALIQFKLKSDFSDSKCILPSPTLEKLIFFPEENFLTISYIIDEEVVVFPCSNISTFNI